MRKDFSSSWRGEKPSTRKRGFSPLQTSPLFPAPLRGKPLRTPCFCAYCACFFPEAALCAICAAFGFQAPENPVLLRDFFFQAHHAVFLMPSTALRDGAASLLDFLSAEQVRYVLDVIRSLLRGKATQGSALFAGVLLPVPTLRGGAGKGRVAARRRGSFRA